MGDDLRDWLEKVDRMGQLKRIEGADWDLEIGCITGLNVKEKKNPSALLFDNIKGYPGGYRVLTCSASAPSLVALTLNLPVSYSHLELVAALQRKLPEWEMKADRFLPQMVETGPVLENVHSGNDIDLFEFPTPKWCELDGGRYIGTGDAVITRDPDTGVVNLGTYRVMVQDRKTTGLHASPGKHGRIHCEKYHKRGKACPVAVSLGQHPLIFSIARIAVPEGTEYGFMGAVREEPIKVIKEEITGLPIPADSEVVIAGWCPPGKTMIEGPFGEFTGYYASKERPAPIIEVERIYHRNNPIILGCPNHRPPSNESFYYEQVLKSAIVHNELIRSGIPDVRGVWISDVGLQQLIVVSIKQRYAGHAKRAALLASQSRVGAYMGRYVIVVDEDIDPTNIQDVLWALCTRSDPEKSIDIIRRAWSTPLDPVIRKPTEAFFNSRAIIDACKPYEWIDEFPEEIKTSPELIEKVKQKWGNVLG